MLSAIPFSKNQLINALVTTLFAMYILTLPRYIDVAKYCFVLLILSAFIYLAANIRQILQTSNAERAFFLVVITDFVWIAFTYYLNGEPGQGDSFVWSRHFYMLFLIPMFFLFRKYEISEKTIVILLVVSVAISSADILVDTAQGVYYSIKGMNRNGFGPVQLCLSGVLFLYFIRRPGQALRWLALVGFFMGIATVIFSESRTTWISMVVLAVFFTFYLARNLPPWRLTVLTMGVALILSSSYLLPIVKSRIDYGITGIQNYLASNDRHDVARQSSVGMRIELWKTGWYIFLEHPVTGVGVGGFKIMAGANAERYQVNAEVGHYKYVHNQYLATLATRGVPGLILFLLFMSLPIYLAMSRKPDDRGAEVARLSVILVCLAYLVGCLGEDHFETQPGIMFMSVFLALLLARISVSNLDPGARLQSDARPRC
jgi:O-antigen ligase